jgi:hypothetical protein
MKVRINAGGREVEVDGDEHSAEQALKLWKDVEVPKPEPGPALGFQASLAGEPRSRFIDTQPLKVTS